MYVFRPLQQGDSVTSSVSDDVYKFTGSDVGYASAFNMIGSLYKRIVADDSNEAEISTHCQIRAPECWAFGKVGIY